MKRLAALLIAGLSGCAIQPQMDTVYQVERIADQAVLAGNPPTLTLSGNNRAYGSAGCNRWFASYTLQDENIRFQQAASTRMFCEGGLMEQEQRFLELLGKIRRWELAGDGSLRLWPTSGEPLLLRPEAH